MRERPILFGAPMVRALLNCTKSQTRRSVKNQPPADCCRVMVGNYHPTVIDRNGHEQPGPEVFGACSEDGAWGLVSPYGMPGDRLWVRETFWCDDEDGSIIYRASGDAGIVETNKHETGLARYNWRPAIFMPRWASRITLEVTGVRVERLQDISEADAIAEGCCADKVYTWWQGYFYQKGIDDLTHGEAIGDEPPGWMIEPKKMKHRPWLHRDARWNYKILWESINGPGSWKINPSVWVIEFRRMESHA